jgi:hypothetical protein
MEGLIRKNGHKLSNLLSTVGGSTTENMWKMLENDTRERNTAIAFCEIGRNFSTDLANFGNMPVIEEKPNKITLKKVVKTKEKETKGRKITSEVEIPEVFDENASIQAENFRKMILTISDDFRVVLIKLADRLHNMRTLGSMRPEKQLKIASETKFLYAPLAHRLGLYSVKSELEDLAFQTLDSERTIDYLLKTELSDLPDQPKWVDGSGLSRHNLITPRSLIRLFEKLTVLMPEEELEEYLAVGGKTGTLKNTFQAATPYIFAKTGSMSHSYNLAGKVKTKSGKTYAFAFMNSNFPFPVSTVRKEVEKVMIQVRDHF